MSKALRRIVILICIAGVFLALMPASALAASRKKDASEPVEIRMYFDRLFAGKAYRVEQTVFLPVQDVCAYFGMDLLMYTDDEFASFRAFCSGLDISATKEDLYAQVNGRYLYLPEQYLVISDTLCLPLSAVCKIFNFTGELSDDGTRVDLQTLEMEILQGGSNYYSTICTNDDFFWLSRIIYAESGHQVLEGRIGVGNVVLNRVASDRFPDTIYDVVYDDEYFLQFSPTLSGSIYNQPDELSVVAAYLCLEGYNTVDDSVFFVNPYAVDSSGFHKYEFVKQIGDHEFYALRDD